MTAVPGEAAGSFRLALVCGWLCGYPRLGSYAFGIDVALRRVKMLVERVANAGWGWWALGALVWVAVALTISIFFEIEPKWVNLSMRS
jgi:hypothetical protein